MNDVKTSLKTKRIVEFIKDCNKFYEIVYSDPIGLTSKNIEDLLYISSKVVHDNAEIHMAYGNFYLILYVAPLYIKLVRFLSDADFDSCKVYNLHEFLELDIEPKLKRLVIDNLDLFNRPE